MAPKDTKLKVVESIQDDVNKGSAKTNFGWSLFT